MANRITNNFISRVKKYLRDNDLKYIDIEGSKNILLLRSAGDYHYLAIQFFDMPEKWVYQQRHFKIKSAYAIEYKQLINAINRYLDATTTDIR